jgi:putative transposase
MSREVAYLFESYVRHPRSPRRIAAAAYARSHFVAAFGSIDLRNAARELLRSLLANPDLPLRFSSTGIQSPAFLKDGQMKRARFTEDQIIGVLKEHEAGAKTADLARKHGVSEATLYNWKAKYGGMDVSEAKRLKQLEDENAKLKKLLAEQMLDAAALRELLSKKW